MRIVRPIILVSVLLLLAGCGVQSSGPSDGPRAPTGIARGVDVYFLDGRDELRPQWRPTGNLGTIGEVMYMLLSGPGESHLHSGIAPVSVTQVGVIIEHGVIRLTMPLTLAEVTPLGIDQIVCSALGAYVQGGGSPETKVQTEFVRPVTEASERLRTCPLFD